MTPETIQETLPEIKIFCSNCGLGLWFDKGEVQFNCHQCGTLITRDTALPLDQHEQASKVQETYRIQDKT